MSPIYDRDYMRSREERGPLGWLNPNGSMVKALILANVAVFLLDALSNHALTDLLMLHPWYISHLQLWRLFSYQFAHGGFMHLLFNMYGLWLFGQGVEQLLGPRRFLQLYLFSGVVGALIWLLANWWGDGVAVIVQFHFLFSRRFPPHEAHGNRRADGNHPNTYNIIPFSAKT